MSYTDSELIVISDKHGYLLLSDDNDLGRFAEKECGITVVDLPTLLYTLKTAKKITIKEMTRIIADLEKKDSYRFKETVKNILLYD